MYTIISLKMYSFINGEKRRRKGGGFNAFICSNITYQYICTTLSKDSKFTGNMDLILQKTKLTSVQIPINNNNRNSRVQLPITHIYNVHLFYNTNTFQHFGYITMETFTHLLIITNLQMEVSILS